MSRSRLLTVLRSYTFPHFAFHDAENSYLSKRLIDAVFEGPFPHETLAVVLWLVGPRRDKRPDFPPETLVAARAGLASLRCGGFVNGGEV